MADNRHVYGKAFIDCFMETSTERGGTTDGSKQTRECLSQ